MVFKSLSSIWPVFSYAEITPELSGAQKSGRVYLVGINWRQGTGAISCVPAPRLFVEQPGARPAPQRLRDSSLPKAGGQDQQGK